MPRIAQYEGNQVRSQVVAQPRAQGAPAAAFASPIAEGVLDIAQAGIDLKQRVDTTSAEEALVRFERDKNDLFFNPDSGYFNTQGRNAYDNSASASQAIDDLKTKYGETLGQQAKLMFDGAADQHITRSQLDITKHSAKGLKTWEIATIEAQVENSVENASLYWNDPDRLRVQNVVGEQAVLDSAHMTGIGPEATAERLQTFRSSFARSTVEAATQSSAAEGKVALDEYGDRLEGPDKVKMEGAIERKAKIEKTQSDAQSAVLTATRLVDQHDSRSDVIEEVNQIEDPDLRKETMSASMSMFGRKKQAESEARADSFESAESHIIGGGSAEGFKAENPESWERLSPKQQRSIESGKAISTDWNTFSDLMLLPKAKLAKIDPTDYYDRLSGTERKSLISAVKSANGTGSSSDKVDHQVGRTRSAQTTAAVEQLYGKKSKRSSEKREQSNAFYALLDDEVRFRESEKDGRLTSEEFTDVLSGLTRNVVQEGFIFDTELDLTDIPPDDVPVLSKFLRDNRIPVTSDNLIRAYEQASK